MNLRWRKHQRADPDFLHVIDLDKRDGNPLSLCGHVLLNSDARIKADAENRIDLAADFGESRAGKCPKCFKIKCRMMQNEKRSA